MNRQRPPQRSSQFVSLRIASEELGLPYHLLYNAVKSGKVATFSMGDDAKRATIYVLRDSLNAFITARLTKEAA